MVHQVFQLSQLQSHQFPNKTADGTRHRKFLAQTGDGKFKFPILDVSSLLGNTNTIMMRC